MDTLTQLRLLWLGGLAVLLGLALGTALVLSWLVRLRNRAPLEGASHAESQMGPAMR